ncbi:MAG: four helix bundle protein [Bacteroidota bacterium]|nr:four helix bundle protein [Bacteroidota bacterium]
MAERINTYKELRVYQEAFEAAMEIFEITKKFPIEERYSLVDQIRKSSRSVCSNLGEFWRKRRYKAAFISKLSDAETEACETQIWLEFSYKCKYIDESILNKLYAKYEKIISQIICIINDPDKWFIKSKMNNHK